MAAETLGCFGCTRYVCIHRSAVALVPLAGTIPDFWQRAIQSNAFGEIAFGVAFLRMARKALMNCIARACARVNERRGHERGSGDHKFLHGWPPYVISSASLFGRALDDGPRSALADFLAARGFGSLSDRAVSITGGFAITWLARARFPHQRSRQW
jgi:hypothetical protein